MGLFQRFLDWLRALFWKEEMELTLVGLQYSGKTTFVNVLGMTHNYDSSNNDSFSIGKLLRRFDTDSRVQHEKSTKRKCFN